jgi:hypothetical protein
MYARRFVAVFTRPRHWCVLCEMTLHVSTPFKIYLNVSFYSHRFSRLSLSVRNSRRYFVVLIQILIQERAL